LAAFGSDWRPLGCPRDPGNLKPFVLQDVTMELGSDALVSLYGVLCQYAPCPLQGQIQTTLGVLLGGFLKTPPDSTVVQYECYSRRTSQQQKHNIFRNGNNMDIFRKMRIYSVAS
jgi:hypothetical protein